MSSSDEEDNAMSEAAMDAEWKRIQNKTFTRWCNEHLKKQSVAIQIEDLATDFSDGIRLIVLLEVLSQKKIGRYNKKPRVHAQCMENIQQALEFIMKKERIRLVNIGAGDISKGNLKLILGLVWTLILHYQISIGFGIDDDDRKGGLTAKQALLNWIQQKIPQKNITNFTKDWNDGTAIAALTDAMAPGLCPENEEMDPANSLQNATHAMKLSEDWLGVPQLLGPEDMVNPHVDELSMMTYLSQFPEAKLKPGAPIKVRGDPLKVKVYGPGVEKEGLDTDMPSADFTVDASNAGGVGKAKVVVEGPLGRPIPCTVTDNGDGTYSCSYVPKDVGDYYVKVNYAGKPAGKSPYHVKVAPGASVPKPDAVRAWGPGLEKVVALEPAKFTIDASNAGNGDIGLAISGPAECVVDCTDNGDGTFDCQYVAPLPGVYKVDLKFADKDVPGSPFRVPCERAPPDASKCVIHGVENPRKFTVDCRNAGGSGLLEVGVTGSYVPCEYVSVRHNGNYTFDVSYDVRERGQTTISVMWHGKHLTGSPFTINI